MNWRANTYVARTEVPLPHRFCWFEPRGCFRCNPRSSSWFRHQDWSWKYLEMKLKKNCWHKSFFENDRMDVSSTFFDDERDKLLLLWQWRMNEKVVFVRETICDVICIYRMPYDTRGTTLSRATKYEGVAHMLFSAHPVFVCVTCFVVSNEEKKIVGLLSEEGWVWGTHSSILCTHFIGNDKTYFIFESKTIFIEDLKKPCGAFQQ